MPTDKVILQKRLEAGYVFRTNSFRPMPGSLKGELFHR
jgi:hypothetical protein